MKPFYLLLPFLGSTATVASVAQNHPNILVVLADDAGYADFGFMGSHEMQTPHIDSLAASGRIFTDAHVAATVSSPSRAMLMIGRYGQRFGYECNTGRGQGLPEDEEILPAFLKRYHYQTACIGKWHLGTLPFQHPNAKGFDAFYGLIGGSRSYFYEPEGADKQGKDSQYQYNGQPIRFDGYFTDELTQKAKQVIRKSNQPFMMYLSYTAPHSPNQATKEDLERFQGHPRQKLAAMMHGLDRGIGEVVNELKRTGKFDNTLIFFLSDNGGATTNQSSNLPLKGFKGNKFEGGHRVPFFVVWGDRFQNKKPFTGLTSSLDIFATIADVLQVKPAALHKPIDGVSLLPYLTGKKCGNPHEVLFWRKMDSRAIREGDYKLIMTLGVDTVLYNLREGIGETNDQMRKEPKRVRKMMEQLSRWERQECIPAKWEEEGWKKITNGYHRRLMNNEIKTAEDLRK